jgi:hypothetical protein
MSPPTTWLKIPLQPHNKRVTGAGRLSNFTAKANNSPASSDRLARINHIGCAILVWIRLKQVAEETAQTIYQVKHGLLSEYLRQQLKSPSIKMMLA